MTDLAPAVHVFQVRLIVLTDQAGRSVDGLVADVWARLGQAMTGKEPTRARVVAFQALTDLQKLPDFLAGRLAGVATETADHVTRGLLAAGAVMVEAAKPFRKPSKIAAEALVKNAGWRARMEALTRLADPAQLASAIAAGVAAGETPAKIAKRIRPLVGNVASSAKRVARTEAVRVAHEIELASYEQLGELVVGYEVHATLDQHTRPEHRRRNGQKYWRDPVGNEIGFADMPRPPLEADGSVAHNCRCYLTPILDDGTRRKPGLSTHLIPVGA